MFLCSVLLHLEQKSPQTWQRKFFPILIFHAFQHSQINSIKIHSICVDLRLYHGLVVFCQIYSYKHISLVNIQIIVYKLHFSSGIFPFGIKGCTRVFSTTAMHKLHVLLLSSCDKLQKQCSDPQNLRVNELLTSVMTLYLGSARLLKTLAMRYNYSSICNYGFSH